jgi:para-aminobenzoate synthetase component 1
MRKKMISDAPRKRNFVSFSISDFHFIKQQMLTWAASHDSKAGVDIFCFLDNQGYGSSLPVLNVSLPGPEASLPGFECLLAIGTVDSFQAPAGNALRDLKTWAAGKKDWIFGHLAYELAAETEPAAGPPRATAPALPDPVGFPDLFFFVPELVIDLQKERIRIGSLQEDHETIWRQILGTPVPDHNFPLTEPKALVSASDALETTPKRLIPPFIPRFTREEYLATIDALRHHILRGDCYEINFCQEFASQPAYPDPLFTWWALSQASPNPFSAFYRLKERYLFCASPERYLKKKGNMLFSQPIKGTSPRHSNQPLADAACARELFHSAKDRSENVMIVDLVRNDLSKICVPGTVRVGELYGIYPFPQVFQMISTITGEMVAGMDWIDAIRETFPMGSMTGAPKNRVVQLIGQYERSRRGIFSGAVGYITPEGEFDFNVVIRSLLYNRESHYLSYQVGSGITFHSDPQAEYEECLIKAEGIRKALSGFI